MSDPTRQTVDRALAGQLEQRVALAWPPVAWQNVPVVVAVSGGADSVALLRILVAVQAPGAKLWVAHFNHGLRGAQSDADEQFVEKLAASLGLGFRTGRPPGVAVAAGSDGLEAAARGARYAFLSAIAEQLGARYLAVAHTADDQAETILHRALRGTGPAGLAGMARVRALTEAVSLVRPLLGQRRAELRDYLKSIGQDWREDATNAQTDATRNWIRNELLPAVAERVNPAVVEALVRLGALSAEVQSLVAADAEALVERAIARAPASGFVCHCDRLAAQPRYLVREALKLAWRNQGWPEQAMGLVEWEALAALGQGETQAPAERTFPGAIRARRQGNQLSLTRGDGQR
jgi:tRNA(Ile)-lysidine synthase